MIRMIRMMEFGKEKKVGDAPFSGGLKANKLKAMGRWKIEVEV
jgi:hypothetical protein